MHSHTGVLHAYGIGVRADSLRVLKEGLLRCVRSISFLLDRFLHTSHRINWLRFASVTSRAFRILYA